MDWHNILELKKTESKILPFEQAIRSTSEAIAIFNHHGNIIFVNDAAQTIFGYSAEILLQKTFDDLLGDENTSGTGHDILKASFAKGWNGEINYNHPSGMKKVFALSTSPIVTNKDDSPSIICLAREMTLIRQNEQALQESNLLLNSILSTSAYYSIIATDHSGLITIFNQGAERLSGYTAEETINKISIEQLFEPDELERKKRLLESISDETIGDFSSFLKHAAVFYNEEQGSVFREKNGFPLPVMMTISEYHGVSGEKPGFLIFARSIEEQRQAEVDLVKREKFMQSVMETLGNILITLDTSWLIQSVNKTGERLLDMTEDLLIGTKFSSFFAPEYSADSERGPALLENNNVASFESAWIDGRGRKLWVLITISALLNEMESKVGYVVIAKDITELRRNEEQRSILLEIAHVINMAESIEDVCEQSVNTISQLLDMEAGCLLLYNSQAMVLQLTHQMGLPDEIAEQYKFHSVGPDVDTIASKTAYQMETFIVEDINDLSSDDIVRTLMDQQTYRTIISTPLFTSQELVGALQLISSQKAEALEYEIQLSKIIAYELANGIIRRRLEEQAREQAERLSVANNRLLTLNRVTSVLASTLDLGELLKNSLQVILSTVGFKVGRVYLKHEDHLELRATYPMIDRPEHQKITIGLNETIHGRATQGEPVIINDSHSDEATRLDPWLKKFPRFSFGVFPIIHHQTVVGVINLTRASYEPFVPEVIDLLKEICSQLGVAIENARLYAEEQRRVKIQETLNRISQLIASARDLDTVLITSLMEFCKILGAERGSLFFFSDEQHMIDGQVGLGYEENEIQNLHIPVTTLPMVQQVFLTLRPVYLEATKMHEALYGHIDGERKHSAVLSAPLITEDKVMGILFAIFETYKPISTDTIEVAQNIAHQIAGVITRVRLFRKLTETNQELERANKVKSAFLANMSHELRTPLNSIIGFSDFLIRSKKEPLTQRQKDSLEKVLRNARNLLQMINDILDISKIEAGRMEIVPENSSLHDIISASLSVIEPLVNDRPVKLREETHFTFPLIKADATRVRQVLLNLLSNAVKFTTQGEIVLRTSFEKNMIVMQVQDSGIGIDEKVQGTIFIEFTQADSSTTKKYGGTGLGLAISRKFAQMMGGDITIKSTIGIGSTFTFIFPFVPVEKGALPQPAVVQPDVSPAPEQQNDTTIDEPKGEMNNGR